MRLIDWLEHVLLHMIHSLRDNRTIIDDKKGEILMKPNEILQAHLRALENGDWDTALSWIGEDYQFTGVIPFPVSLFIRIGRPQALQMHQARKRALPDFKFNETIVSATDSTIKIEVNLSGTHTGTIDYRGILRGIPVVPPTGKFVQLNPEWFTYTMRDNKIVKTVGQIPKNAGVQGLVRAVTTTG